LSNNSHPFSKETQCRDHCFVSCL